MKMDLFSTLREFSVFLFCTSLINLAQRATAKECSQEVKGCFCIDGTLQCEGRLSLPQTFPSDVDAIFFSGVDVDAIPPKTFSGLKSLKSIKIFDSFIGSVARQSFYGLYNLDSISIVSSTIGEIEAFAFDNIQNVTQLSLTESRIHRIQPNALNNISNLKFFSMSHLNITNVKSFAFSNINNIISFQMRWCNIGKMEPMSVQGWSELSMFIAISNTFDVIGCEVVDYLIGIAGISSFVFNNVTSCSCDLSWAVNNPRVQDYLLSNGCFRTSDSKDFLDFSSLTLGQLNCLEEKPMCILNNTDTIDVTSVPKNGPSSQNYATTPDRSSTSFQTTSKVTQTRSTVMDSSSVSPHTSIETETSRQKQSQTTMSKTTEQEIISSRSTSANTVPPTEVHTEKKLSSNSDVTPTWIKFTTENQMASSSNSKLTPGQINFTKGNQMTSSLTEVTRTGSEAFSTTNSPHNKGSHSTSGGEGAKSNFLVTYIVLAIIAFILNVYI